MHLLGVLVESIHTHRHTFVSATRLLGVLVGPVDVVAAGDDDGQLVRPNVRLADELRSSLPSTRRLSEKHRMEIRYDSDEGG
jgi:hypothetical protein